MPKIINTFIGGRMESDTNYAFVDNKNYIYALNIRPTGYGENGAMHFLKGSESVSDYSDSGTMKSIRLFEGDNNKIYNFLAKEDGLSKIIETDVITKQSKVIIQDNAFLKFNTILSATTPKGQKSYLMSVNQVDDFLIFSHETWRYPKIVNITKSEEYALGFTEDDITLIKKPPFYAPTIVDRGNNQSVADQDIANKFVSFAYRYKYNNGDYTPLSFYTEASFLPNNKTGDKDGFGVNSARKNRAMVNLYNEVVLSVKSGGKDVTDVEVYAREHGSNTAYRIYAGNKEDLSIGNNADIQVIYNYSKKYEVLDEPNTLMLFSNIPMFAKAQDKVGNRLFFGNFVEGFDLKDFNGNKIVIDYEAKKVQSAYVKGEDNKTAISLFSYKPAMIFYNDFNISTTMLLPTDESKAEVNVGFEDRTKVNKIQIEMPSNFIAPEFATKMKVAVKRENLFYENIFFTNIKKIGKKIYLLLTADTTNKVKKGDTLTFTKIGIYGYNEFYVDEVALFRKVEDGVPRDGYYAVITDELGVLTFDKNPGVETPYKGSAGTYPPEHPFPTRPLDSVGQTWFDGETANGVTQFYDRYFKFYNNMGTVTDYNNNTRSDSFGDMNYGSFTTGDEVEVSFSILFYRRLSNGSSDYPLDTVKLKKEAFFVEDGYDNVFELIKDLYSDYRITISGSQGNIDIKTNYDFQSYIVDNFVWAKDLENERGKRIGAIGILEIKVNRGVSGGFARTKNIDQIEDNFYYETDKTYPVVNGIIQADSEVGGKKIFDINFYNGFTWGNGVESYKIRDEFNGKKLNFNFRGNVNEINGYKAIRKKNDITYSGLYNYELKRNELSIFNPTTVNWKTLPTEFGEITRIISTDGDLTVFTLDKVINQYYGKSVIADLQGNENVAMTNDVLSSHQVLQYDGGSQHPESIIYANSTIQFVDKKRSKFLIKAGQNIEELNSQASKFQHEGGEIIKAHNNFVASYDYRHNDYVIGLDHNDSIVFNLEQRGFSHYYNFKFDFSLGMLGRRFTSHNGVLYEDEVTLDYNNFAGQGNFDAKIKYIVNADLASDIIFNAMAIKSNTAWETEVKTNLTATKFSSQVYDKRESYYYTNIFRDSSTKVGVVGIGVIQNIIGNDLYFNHDITNQVSTSDKLINEAETVDVAITNIQGKIISVANTSGLQTGNYVGAKKGQIGTFRPNGVPIRGEWMEVTLTKTGNQDFYISSISTEVLKSTP